MNEAAKKKIAKLLALSLDQAGTPEGKLAGKRAMELMARHGLSRDDIDEDSDTAFGYLTVKVPARKWGETIAVVASNLTGTFIIRTGRKMGSVDICGRKLDCEIAHFLVESLVNQAEADGRKFRRDRPYATLEEAYVYKESWAMGLHMKAKKILEARRLDMEGESTALEPLNRQKQAEQAVRERWNLKQNKDKRGLRASSLRGIQDGKNANVQTGVKGQKARLLKK